MVHSVKKVRYLEGYKLYLTFNDRKIKIVDLSSILKNAKNMLLALVEIDYFKQVACDGTTIYWPNGVDLCPDVLYSMGKSPQKVPAKRTKRPLRVSTTRARIKRKVVSSKSVLRGQE